MTEKKRQIFAIAKVDYMAYRAPVVQAYVKAYDEMDAIALYEINTRTKFCIGFNLVYKASESDIPKIIGI